LEASPLLSKEYIAGFFDGEGCIRIHVIKSSRARPQYQLEASISQKRREVLDLVSAQYGGVVRKERQGKYICYRLTLSGLASEKLLRDILPYMVVKKKEAETALEYRETAVGYGNYELKEFFHKKLQELKVAA
jgi:hypothetical protein